MSVINYLEIEEKLAEIFKKDARTARIHNRETTIWVEENASQLTDLAPFIGIYLDGWESPAEDEFVGGRIKTFLDLELVLYEFNLENKEACRRRDEILKIVKQVMLDNRKIDGIVLMTTFRGGTFENAKGQGRTGDSEIGFFKGVTLKFRCELRE